MCFTSPSLGTKIGSGKTGSKAGKERSRISLASDRARFSFSSTSKLPSNLFIRQDFYGTDKINLSYLPASRPAGTLSAHILSQSTAQPFTDDVISQIWAAQYANLPAPPSPPTTNSPSATRPTGAELISAVSAAQHLAHSLQEACATPHSTHSSHPSCSSCTCNPGSNEKKRIHDHDQRDSLILSRERKNAEDIAALKLDRDIDNKVTRAIRDKEIQALINAAKSGDLGGEGWRWGKSHDQNNLSRAELELEQREARLLLRERERERKLLSFDGGSSNSGGAKPTSEAQFQFNLFQDLSTGRGDGNGNANGRAEARTYYMDGLRNGLERRRSSVVGTLDRGARRFMDTVARVEAEAECMRRRGRRERQREREKNLDLDRWDRWDRRGSADSRGW